MIGGFMRSLLVATALVASLSLSVTGCASAISNSQPTPPSSAPTTDSASTGSETIEEVWALVGCKANDPLGTRAVILPTPSAGLERTGTCSPDEENLVFFYEATDREAMDTYVASGALELGVGDVLFQDGAVLMLVRDAATATQFASMFDQVA